MTSYTSVTVARADLEVGQLPPVCVRTGEPAVRYEKVRFRNRRRRSWLTIILIGWIEALIWRVIGGHRVTGHVPVTEHTHKARTRFRLISCAAMWVTAVAFAVGIAMSTSVTPKTKPISPLSTSGTPETKPISPLLPWGAFSCLFVLIAHYRVAPRIFIRATINDDWVTLKGVHPEFARACGSAMAERLHSPSPTRW